VVFVSIHVHSSGKLLYIISLKGIPMQITFDKNPKKLPALAVFALEGGKVLADKKVQAALKPALAAEKFEGKKGQMLVLPAMAGHVAVIGLGKVAALKLKDFESFGSSLVSALNARKVAAANVVFSVPGLKGAAEEAAAARMAAAALLNTYRFDKYLTKEPKEKKPALKALHFALDEAAKARALFAPQEKVARGVFLTRDLVSEPPNVLYPESFANIIKKQLAPLGVTVKILGAAELKKRGMGALVAVGQGSERPPCLVTMEYKGGRKGAAPVAFVGKGITFDTGGISIKPAAGMDEMKWDMGGAGAVTGLMYALAARRAKANVVGVVALAENMPSGGACRPGDIVTSLSGQTVEILNTDAEGRLVLCDALWYCQQAFRPAQIVDLATLTGAMIMALGHEYGGVFSNDDALAARLVHAGKETGEELWRMPLNDAWDKALDSPAADIKNIAAPNVGAGSAIGAHFLKRFIQKDVKWAHLDIAGMAWAYKDGPGVPKGAAGFGVRLLDRFVAEYCEG
jgi:leucyl aminopeptidase